jgi:hypothetical protein
LRKKERKKELKKQVDITLVFKPHIQKEAP